MKKIILTLFVSILSTSAFATTLCTADLGDNTQRTMLILEQGQLQALCQKPNSGTELSNMQVCADDMFVMTSFSNTGSSASSLKTEALITLSELKLESGKVNFSKDYSTSAFEGDRKISVPAGSYNVSCKEI